MSDEILFTDMLNHYSLKFLEATDLLNNAVSYLNSFLSLANESWDSESSNLLNEKMLISKKYISNINDSMDEILELLNVLKNDNLNNEIEQLNQNIVVE
jgi:hypothetical protein